MLEDDVRILNPIYKTRLIGRLFRQPAETLTKITAQDLLR